MSRKQLAAVDGMWGLKCWRSNSGAFIPYVPSIIFLCSYFLAFHQLSSVAFPSRARMTFVIRWLISVLLLSHAIDFWHQVIMFLDFLVELYIEGQPYFLKISSTTALQVPSLNADYVKLFILFLISILPLTINYLVIRQQQRLSRFTWFDIRRRYRNELGSGRYYLSRPCSTLEAEKKIINFKRIRSEEYLKPLPVPYLKPKPKTA